MESLATPQEADLDDQQIRMLLASPPYLPEREASAEGSQISHSAARRIDVQFVSKSELFSAQGNLWHGSHIRKE